MRHLQLTPLHLAYLRSLAQGLPAHDAARQYLNLQHAAAFSGVHQSVIDLARAVAKRWGYNDYRLLGVRIDPAPTAPADRPPLDTWAAASGLEDWSHAELLALYADAFPVAPDALADTRKTIRNARLIARRLVLIEELGRRAAAPASPGDPVSAWLTGPVVPRLTAAGINTLGSLVERIQTGGRWWAGVPSFGPLKAQRVALIISTLLPMADPPTFDLLAPPTPTGGALTHAQAADQEAIERWIRARANSRSTDIIYRREACRFLLFCAERGVSFSSCSSDDCVAYSNFLADIPSRWITRRRAAPFTPGWAPFRGQLSDAARALSLSTLRALFAWLCSAGHLPRNVWILVTTALPNARIVLPSSKAIPAPAWQAFLDYLAASVPCPAGVRMQFTLQFSLDTGLRPSEILDARLGHLSVLNSDVHVLSVVGKGGKARLVPLTSGVISALRSYLDFRGLPSSDLDLLPDVPLVASTLDPVSPVSYRVFLRSFSSLLGKALKSSDLPADLQRRVASLGLHSLRHTHSIRFVEAGGPVDILQQNLGHTDLKTTAGYYHGELTRRADMIRSVFQDSGTL